MGPTSKSLRRSKSPPVKERKKDPEKRRSDLLGSVDALLAKHKKKEDKIEVSDDSIDDFMAALENEPERPPLPKVVEEPKSENVVSLPSPEVSPERKNEKEEEE